MPNDVNPSQLPTLSDQIAAWLGFQLPSIPLLRTAANVDKAISRLVLATGDNLASRIEQNTSTRRARERAVTSVIDASGTYVAGKLSEDSTIRDRAVSFTFGESILRQENRESIARLAIEDLTLKTTANPADATDEIDDDWLNVFSDFSASKSNSQIQSLWGRILSGKIRNPSSFSLQSLQLLSNLDSSDANLIHSVLSYAIGRSFIYKEPSWQDISRFITCEDLGVLSGTSGMLNRSFVPQQSQGQNIAQLGGLAAFEMAGSFLLITMPAYTVQIPCFNLTRFGIELLALTEGLSRDPSYEESFITFLKSNGATVKRALTGSLPEGTSATLEDV